MFSSVVRPSQLPLDHHPSFEPYTRQNANHDTMLYNPLPLRDTPIQRGFSTPSISSQHAFPIQKLAFQVPPSGADPRSYQSEHTLRRKTPNGTLAAGYDGTPIDRAIQPPAAKHILVSLPDTGNTLSPRSALPVNLWQHRTVPGNFGPQQYPFDSTYNDASIGRGQNNGMGSDPNGGGWVRSLGYPPGMDSVLNQTLPVQTGQRYYVAHGSTIPTVLPATLQPFPGPTASAGAGPYGPYWPNGTYVPYRPAPFRDARFQRDLTFTGQIPDTGLGYHLGHNNTFNQGPLPPQEAINGNGSWKSSAPSFQTPGHPLNLNFHSQHNQQRTNSFAAEQSNFIPHQYRKHSYDTISTVRGPNDFMNWQTFNDFDRPQILAADIFTRSGNAEFKEKVLSWAHSVYVELLASIHQSKRNNAYKGSNDGHSCQASQPNIYPKPPRQPASDFSFPYSEVERPDYSKQPSAHAAGHLQCSTDTSVPRPGSSLSRPSTAIHSPLLQSSNQPHERGTTTQPHHRNPSSDHYSDRFRTLRKSATASVPRLYASHQHEAPVNTKAMAALDMLTNLCQESSWEWIDGMLLGGCLAYGLGDYNKATRWYSRILAKDSGHVEAISNLAATLLSLNRREEALQYWLRAVKLRPSYFEAVEHLIGLLCGSQRGKEAVNIIEFVQKSLRTTKSIDYVDAADQSSEVESETKSRSSSVSTMESLDKAVYDYDDGEESIVPDLQNLEGTAAGFGTSGYAIPGSESGRMLALVHAKGNMLYALGDNQGAAAAFEDAILIGAGRRKHGIQGLIRQVLSVFTSDRPENDFLSPRTASKEPILLLPEKALQTAKLVFLPHGNLPGLEHVSVGMAKKAAISTTSNSLLSLAKIYQDGMSSSTSSRGPKASCGVRDILALYYLSLALQPSPSTANNVGILLASVQQSVPIKASVRPTDGQIPDIPGVVQGSGIALALAYYNYGLNLDSRHAHLYTNLGSLLKDIGQLPAAIKMYEQAVQCDGSFDIALANLANAVKDQGRISDAITYYRRAVTANPDFAEAVCGLANALNSVCGWTGRGGIIADHGLRDRWHVDEKGMLLDAKSLRSISSGWIKRVVEIVGKQLKEGEYWGRGSLSSVAIELLCKQLTVSDDNLKRSSERTQSIHATLKRWSEQKWEGARLVKLVERAIQQRSWQWYQDRYVYGKEYQLARYARPQLPAGLASPNAPTVLPFHTFTCPLSAKQIRLISQRNGLRISCSTLRSTWLPNTVYRPPAPPNPCLNVGYVSSDFNNHPLAHLMQSVFGFHSPSRVKAFCYATTASDNSIHRKQIEDEAPVFYDASAWSIDKLVGQIVSDGIHILINLNGYTSGARNEVFAARPAPIQMSFMGFAGTLGAEWCDYLLADEISIPRQTLSPWRSKVAVEDRLRDEANAEDQEDWVYDENIIFARDTFFCCDHRQSAPDSQDERLSWEEEQEKRWQMRKELFPTLADDAIILGNFNQLYKIEPTTFRIWLRILARVPRAILWLLRFPDLGEQNLRATAAAWAGESIVNRIIFTDVAPKHQHISRARVCDLFLDTPECNAHTTAADVLWSGTPLLTYPRYDYKMCSRMASSILSSALPKGSEGDRARKELITGSDEEYEATAIRLAGDLTYPSGCNGLGRGQLVELRKMLFLGRWESALFDTRRWVRDLEDAYEEAWRRWVQGEGGDIWL